MAESLGTSNKPKASSDKPTRKSSYRVLFSNPMPAYDTAHARAYQAQAANGDNNFLAYLCNRQYFPRLSASDAFIRMRYSAMIRFKEWHLLRDAEGIERVVLIYRNPNLNLYLDSMDATTNSIGLRECVNHFLKPVIEPLHAMHKEGITYRAFSATNLFGTSPPVQNFVLGQCLTEPAGSIQPRIFETPTAAMAEPQGRGSETIASDYYALGVMVLTLLRGHVPLRMLSEEAVIIQKSRLGSYRALIEHTPLDAESADLIRGLLDDSPGTRWGYEQVISWLGGYRRAVDNHFTPPRAKVPYYIQENIITTRQEMSYILHKNWQEGLELGKNPDLAHWLRRSFADDANAREIILLQEKMTTRDGNKSNNLTDALSRILILLNPLAPILWENSGSTVTGIPNMMAKYYSQRTKIKTIIKLLQNGTHDFWMRNYLHSAPTYIANVNMLTSLTKRMLHSDKETQMLRFMYTINRDAPCMSPLFARDYVYGIKNLLKYIEKRVTQQEEGSRLLLDTHILAYIAAYSHYDLTNLVEDSLLDSDIIKSGLAQVRMLSYVQQGYDKTATPSLCKALLPLLEPALERFKNTKKKEILRSQLHKCSKNGWLQSMLAAADNQSLLAQDSQEYGNAQRRYKANEKLLLAIAEAQHNLHANTKERAQKLALTASSSIMVVGFLTLLLKII